jgi:hypothetical protein
MLRFLEGSTGSYRSDTQGKTLEAEGLQNPPQERGTLTFVSGYKTLG